ncbi:hypothetical protein HWV62_35360 [Athelia sp. TMB]|nr:hypothetical protein HWV62_35360 [Athelia sp. TMB]
MQKGLPLDFHCCSRLPGEAKVVGLFHLVLPLRRFVTGLIQARSATDNTVVGYVAENTGNNHFGITYDPTAAILFSLSVDPTAAVSSQLDISATTTTYAATWPLMGGIDGVVNDSDDLHTGSDKTTHTDPGSPPASVSNSYPSPEDAESAIWTYTSATQAITSQWVNTDSSLPPTAIEWVPGSNALAITGDSAAFESAFATSQAVVGTPVSEITGDTSLTSSEKRSIRPALVHARRDLADLDEALAHIESVREQMLSKRDALKAYLDTCSGLLSPVGSMPQELLAEIFSYLKHNYYARPAGSSTPIITTSVCDPALNEVVKLSHVCRQWRSAALHTHSLWDNIRVHVQGPMSVECVQAWLVRSGSCPLSVDIQCRTGSTSGTWNDMLDIMLPQSHRWRHATIMLQEGSHLSRIRDRLPLLETLEVQVPTSHSEFIPQSAFEIAPMLRSVRVNGWIHRVGQLPWAQLTSFHASECSVQQSLILLQAMPDIVSFTATVHDLPAESRLYSASSPPLRLAKLEHLDLRAMNSGPIQPRLFGSLDLPSLKTLAFRERYWAFLSAWTPSMIALIQRSSYDLTYLELTLGTMYSQESADDLVRACPRLEHLVLAHNPDHNASWGYTKVMEALTVLPSGATSYVAPRLRALEVDYARGFQLHAFADMIESRWKRGSETYEESPVARMDYISLRCVLHAADFEEALARLKAFEAEGLNLNIHFIDADCR